MPDFSLYYSITHNIIEIILSCQFKTQIIQKILFLDSQIKHCLSTTALLFGPGLNLGSLVNTILADKQPNEV